MNADADNSTLVVRTESIPKPILARRRQFLSAIGVGSMIALAGCVGAADEGTGGTSTQGASEMDAAEDEGTIDPLFGYTGRTPDEEPPVAPDHEIQLLIRPRDNGGEIPEFYFEPTGLYIDAGDTVKFTMTTPHHNVNAIHAAFGYEQRVPEGVPPFSSPVLTGGAYWLYTFEEEGVYDFVCSPHEAFGIVGRLVVGSAIGPGANPIGEAAEEDEEARPPLLTASLVLSDPALDPDRIVENERVPWDEIAPENKRLLVQIPDAGDESGATHRAHR